MVAVILWLLVLVVVQNAADQLESRKFLPLIYQLAARMSDITVDSSEFQKILQEVDHSSLYLPSLHATSLLQIIFKTALDHPYHSLYVIFALSNACKDNEFPIQGHVSGAKKTKQRRSTSALQSDVDKVCCSLHSNATCSGFTLF